VLTEDYEKKLREVTEKAAAASAATAYLEQPAPSKASFHSVGAQTKSSLKTERVDDRATERLLVQEEPINI